MPNQTFADRIAAVQGELQFRQLHVSQLQAQLQEALAEVLKLQARLQVLQEMQVEAGETPDAAAVQQDQTIDQGLRLVRLQDEQHTEQLEGVVNMLDQQVNPDPSVPSVPPVQNAAGAQVHDPSTQQ